MTDDPDLDSPFIVMVAPNGAYLTKDDHPALPLRPQEIARTAAECREAGAAMLHLHVRDAAGRHLLNVDAYAQTLDAVAAEAGRDLLCQISTEAAGRYGPEEQMAVVTELRPEAASVSLRELVSRPERETDVARFLLWARTEGVRVQYILYDVADVLQFNDWWGRGLIPGPRPFVLFVVGRRPPGPPGRPRDLVTPLGLAAPEAMWAVCAFGRLEGACALTAAAMGGHSRIGFENNLRLANGEIAPDNRSLVAQAVRGGMAVGRPIATAAQVRELLV
ncbi:MAG: 3-keto-5-aminohexanoate cleavage protein [Alphaproteobacteria bacterium]|jgi:uncharacterized protein (DUF849 family)|nr:3-keto-5-aminohexanoate cleavage protein [Alphaproteobacteria bacterium]